MYSLCTSVITSLRQNRGHFINGVGEFAGGLAVKDLELSLPWRRFDCWPGNLNAAGLAKKSVAASDYSNLCTNPNKNT